jgi:hypothetical protein
VQFVDVVSMHEKIQIHGRPGHAEDPHGKTSYGGIPDLKAVKLRQQGF